jgi:hypothetical protein
VVSAPWPLEPQGPQTMAKDVRTRVVHEEDTWHMTHPKVMTTVRCKCLLLQGVASSTVHTIHVL